MYWACDVSDAQYQESDEQMRAERGRGIERGGRQKVMARFLARTKARMPGGARVFARVEVLVTLGILAFLAAVGVTHL